MNDLAMVSQYDMDLRHMKLSLFDAPVHDAIKPLTAAGQRLGLQMFLDDDPKWWGEVCAERHADAAMRVIHPAEAKVLGGAFEVHVPAHSRHGEGAGAV